MYKYYTAEFYHGVELFNLEEFYDQHNQFEDIWRKTSKDNIIRVLYQGILNIGVGFYHFKKNNPLGTQRQLIKGLKRLKHFHEILKDNNELDQNTEINSSWLTQFIIDVENWYKWFETAKDYNRHPPFPKILIRLNIPKKEVNS